MWPASDQNLVDTRRVENLRTVNVSYVSIIQNNNTIPAAGMLLESDVNARVSLYAQGAVSDMVLAANRNRTEWLASEYNTASSSLTSAANGTAHNAFREGNY